MMVPRYGVMFRDAQWMRTHTNSHHIEEDFVGNETYALWSLDKARMEFERQQLIEYLSDRIIKFHELIAELEKAHVHICGYIKEEHV